MEQAEYIEFITERLEKYPVLFAYLFGSEATGKTTKLSDIDVAVYFEKGLNKSEAFDLGLRLANELSFMPGKKADVSIMNKAPVRLAYEIIKNGKVLFCKDRDKRVETEIYILSKYLDRRYYDKRRAEFILHNIKTKGLVTK